MAHVLLIDDEPNIVLALTLLLQQAGFTVTSAASGEQAQALLERGALPDLVLLDIGLPGMNGFELLAQLRANAATHALPVMLVTACGNRADRAKGAALGADDYLIKPFAPQVLMSRVNSLLAMRCS